MNGTRRSATVSSRTPLSIVVPVGLISGASAAMIPAVLALALASGASVAEAGLVTTMAATGQVLATVPAGQAVARFGARATLPVAAAVIALGLLSLFLATGAIGLGLGVLAVGAGGAVHVVCRLTAVAEDIPAADRGHAFVQISLAQRIGWIGGPLLGALAFTSTGLTSGPIIVASALAALAFIIHLATRAPAAGLAPHTPHPKTPVLRTVAENRNKILRVGAITATIAGLRHIKIVLVPMVALGAGFNLGEVSVLLSVTAVIGIVGAWAAGKLSALRGSVTAGLISNAMITAGLSALIFAQAHLAIILAVVLIEVGHGFGSGFLSTLFADEAPAMSPAPLLGVFNLIAEAVSVAAPAAILGVVAAATLPVGVAAGAAFGALGFACLAFMRRSHQPDAD